jgi:predicted Ser/Thr protein kinase/tetratricopeptide (TPR) repeat protein
MSSEVTRTLGKYQLLEVLGRGGMGEVVKAWQPDLNRFVAIKTLLAGEQATDGFLERFRREAQVAAGLAHPSIVQVYDFGTEGRLHYIVMEYVEGRSLKEVLARGKLEPAEALRIARAAARTLQFAHERKIVHRDIKPANLLIDPQGRVRILDFGLAKSLAEGKALTLSHTMLGTPYYMSPEQAFGAPEEVDARADVYSLGAVLYEMLAGRPPFEGGTVLAVLRKIEDEDPAPPGISPAIDAIVLKALAKDRERRFQSAGELAGAIEACVGTSAVAGAARRPWGLAGAAAALLVAGLGLGLMRSRPGAVAPAPPPDPDAALRALLARTPEPSAVELAAYREDPGRARLVARHFQERGHFGRALPYLRGYERALGELMSARAIQRFASPGLFKLSIASPPDLKGWEAQLAAALLRHLEGKAEAARLKLRNAENGGAPAAHVLLVRAHMDLWDVYPDPHGEAQQQVLAALRQALEAGEALFLLPLRAVALHLSGDAEAAHAVADRFAQRAPLSAEAFMLQSVLLQLDGKLELAREAMEDAADADPGALDVSIQGVYLKMLDILQDPSMPSLEAARAWMEPALEARLKRDHYPAALFLHAVLRAAAADWEEAADALRKLARRTPLDRVTAGHPRLDAFVWAGESRSRLLEAARDFHAHLGQMTAAVATARLITGEGLPEEDRAPLLRDNHRWMARALLDDQSQALRHLEQALRLGATPAELRDDETLAVLRPRPAFQALLRAHRDVHRRRARLALGDDAAVLAELEEALKFGVPPADLRRDAGLGDFRARSEFAELLRRYED